MILVAIGSNLGSPTIGSPLQVCEAAVQCLCQSGVRVLARSRWFETAPVPVSDQPWYVNGVVAVATDLAPADLLGRLHGIEAGFGRVRRTVNEARVLDLDLLAYDDRVQAGPPVLPHPRMDRRAFVLLPLADIAPDWVHPGTGLCLPDLLAALPSDQQIRPVP
ncbi:2-amino-4-hydroxy-6-hydroxymethyldihydropteridine diphosphokinase [Oleisolibacter albus]|uniref:2-amino-4-hydroxy-6- hydroxymethyldihydropteridine diphosphokinase n=1 Tax=Oleisolibacter albus TaxID=2171757 RepID=UPI000DF2E799|nr:2-amino-4-hydroxy-6-hydroxymethyldihydropteridine diphosphokinase [Oleisolibacter albus]